MKRLRTVDIAGAALFAALVLPVGLLSANGADQQCNHIEGDIEVAEKGTPRGHWCAALQWHWHWLLLVAVPPLVTLAIALAAGRRRWARWAAWGAGVALASVPVMILGTLRAYYLI